MKIGIMSMQRIQNYGSYLQAYGLKKMLENMGAEVEFVDYKTEAPVMEQGMFKSLAFCLKIRRLSRKIKSVLFCRNVNQRKEQRFLRNYNKVYLQELGVSGKKYYRTPVDILVIGSDEVFNCTQNNIDVGFSRQLFGEENRAGKVISYAASFGNTTIEKLNRYQIKENVSGLLENFSAISVRDKNSREIVKTLTGSTPQIHMDPVLVYDYSEDIRDEVQIKDYIIVYAYNSRISEEESKVIQRFARENNKKIVAVSGNQSFCDQYVYCHPLEVLSYFRHADYIITDTFHGTIFSVISHRPFITLVRKDNGRAGYGNEQKLTYLLQSLGLEDRIAWNAAELKQKCGSSIDYRMADIVLERERKRTREYLAEETGLIKELENKDKNDQYYSPNI